MSALAPLRRPAAAPSPAPRPAAAPRPNPLRSAPPAVTARSRVPFALLVTAILVTGLVALLMLHTLAAQDAFRVHSLNQQLSALQDQEQQLRVTNDQLAAPDRLLARARALGMRPMRLSSYQRLHDGRTVASASAVLPPAPAPSASASAGPAASATASPGPTGRRAAAGPSPAPNRSAAHHHHSAASHR